jgi:hypothetical protein
MGAIGYIQRALSNLGHDIARSTIAVILQRHGIEPARERSRKTERVFDAALGSDRAADFFAVEVWTQRGRTMQGDFRIRRALSW